jgi:uncharacterized protein (UPF0210 family)
MRISVEEVFETARMTLDHHFDIRAVTLGINLKDCIDRNVDRLSERIQKRIVEKGLLLNRFADATEQKYGIRITNRRIAVTPVSLLLEPLARKVETAVRLAKALDATAKKANIDFLGGFGALLGSAPIMKVPKAASPKFIARKGRIPSPVQSLRN